MKKITMTIMPPDEEEVTFCFDFDGWMPDEFPLTMKLSCDDAGPALVLMPCANGDGMRIESEQVECATREQGYWGWALFCFVWLCAIAGTIVSFLKLKEHSNMETICFVGMGLSVLVAFKPLIDSVSTAAVIWIIAEGVCYITGAVFYSFNKVRYMHSVFHFFVLAGSVCHIIAVWDVLMSYL